MKPCHANLKPSLGLSLVELLVGLALGLFLVAAALLAFAQHARETRFLLHETRLMQDLRTTMHLMSNNIRRAGHWAAAPSGVWSNDQGPLSPNPHTTFELATEQVRFSHSPPGAQDAKEAEGEGRLGYRLRQGTLEMQMNAGAWQAMTDPGDMRVTAMDLQASTAEEPLGNLCASPCATSAKDTCPPRQLVKRVALHLRAVSARDPSIKRELQSTVRLRNDILIGNCPP